MLEAIKLVGGIAGLLTTAFVIWDRWVRGRPLAWMDATKRFTGNPEEYIRIKNPGYGNVFIRKVRVEPLNIYGVAKDPSVRAITSPFGRALLVTQDPLRKSSTTRRGR
jgi:hypothetical protein